MSDEIKMIDAKEFREQGYLQEVNRQFLHPLGLALVVSRDDDGDEYFQGVWDARDDPEGIYFAGGTERVKRAFIEAQWVARESPRVEALGYMVQP